MCQFARVQMYFFICRPTQLFSELWWNCHNLQVIQSIPWQLCHCTHIHTHTNKHTQTHSHAHTYIHARKPLTHTHVRMYTKLQSWVCLSMRAWSKLGPWAPRSWTMSLNSWHGGWWWQGAWLGNFLKGEGCMRVSVYACVCMRVYACICVCWGLCIYVF